MGKDWPVEILTATIWTYWMTVIVLVLKQRLRHGRRAGVLPKKKREKRLWLGIGPVFLAWNLLPAVAAVVPTGPFSIFGWAAIVPSIYTCRCLAAVLAVLCYLATLSCWLLMGQSWSMAIVPGQKSELITSGLFGWVRHPIYSLSILLMLCTTIVVANVPMLLVAVAHFLLFSAKARMEERHMTERHGESYELYCHRVGRFVPRLRILQGQ